MTTIPDFRALAQELLAATQLYTGLNPAASEMSSVEKTEKLMDAMAATVAALATPPLEPLRPIPVTERLPGPEDCLFNPGATIGFCWIFNPIEVAGGIAWWSFEPLEWSENGTHWLPANAIPLAEETP